MGILFRLGPTNGVFHFLLCLQALQFLFGVVLKEKSGYSAMSHYLDFVLFTSPEAPGQCAHLLTIFLELTWELGVPLAYEKTKDSAQKLTFWVSSGPIFPFP